jgi:type IV secretory pathway VirB10-like protein
MNIRRLSYGLLLTTATALVACGEPAQPETPQGGTTTAATEAPSATPPATSEPTPPAPTATATATATAEAPPPPAPKQAKEKLVGKFTQEFTGEVKDAADAAAKKAAGKADKDGKKYAAAMEKATKAFTDAGSLVENTDKQLVWSLKGKPAHTVSIEIGGGDVNTVTIKLMKDGKTDLKGKEVAITFTDDDTFSMKDPFAKDPKKAQTLVFKRQK